MAADDLTKSSFIPISILTARSDISYHTDKLKEIGEKLVGVLLDPLTEVGEPYIGILQRRRITVEIDKALLIFGEFAIIDILFG